MATVTIPESMNPFIIKINNTTYSFKGGETVDVPNDVAMLLTLNDLDSRNITIGPDGFIEKIARNAEVLEGNREQLSPDMVYDAVMAGKRVILHDRDPKFGDGDLCLTSFITQPDEGLVFTQYFAPFSDEDPGYSGCIVRLIGSKVEHTWYNSEYLVSKYNGQTV